MIRFDDQSSLGDEYAQSREAANAIGIKSAVYVPVPAGGAAVGVCVFRDAIDPFTDDDVALLQSFAVQAASAGSGLGREIPIRMAGVNAKARDQRAPEFVDDFASFVKRRKDPIGQSFDDAEVRSFVTIALLSGDEWLGNINL